MLQALHPLALAGVFDHSNFKAGPCDACHARPPSSGRRPTGRPRRPRRHRRRRRPPRHRGGAPPHPARRYSARDLDLLRWVPRRRGVKFLPRPTVATTGGRCAETSLEVDFAETAVVASCSEASRGAHAAGDGEIRAYFAEVRPHLAVTERTKRRARSSSSSRWGTTRLRVGESRVSARPASASCPGGPVSCTGWGIPRHRTWGRHPGGGGAARRPAVGGPPQPDPRPGNGAGGPAPPPVPRRTTKAKIPVDVTRGPVGSDDMVEATVLEPRSRDRSPPMVARLAVAIVDGHLAAVPRVDSSTRRSCGSRRRPASRRVRVRSSTWSWSTSWAGRRRRADQPRSPG